MNHVCSSHCGRSVGDSDTVTVRLFRIAIDTADSGGNYNRIFKLFVALQKYVINKEENGFVQVFNVKSKRDISEPMN